MVVSTIPDLTSATGPDVHGTNNVGPASESMQPMTTTSTKLNVPLIAGVVAGAAGVILLIVAIVLIRRKRASSHVETAHHMNV